MSGPPRGTARRAGAAPTSSTAEGRKCFHRPHLTHSCWHPCERGRRERWLSPSCRWGRRLFGDNTLCCFFLCVYVVGDRSRFMKIRPPDDRAFRAGKGSWAHPWSRNHRAPASRAQGLDSTAASWDHAGLRLDHPPRTTRHH